MANYTSTYDLLREALSRVGEPIDGTSEYHAKALEYLNKWHLSVLGGSTELGIDLGEPWSWAQTSPVPRSLTLLPMIATGTVSVTAGLAAFSISGLDGSTSIAGRWIRIGNCPDWFYVTAHVAGSGTGTLDTGFTGLTASSAAYEAHQLDYPLAAGLVRLVGPMHHNQTPSGRIDLVDASEFKTNYPLSRLRQGFPDVFTVITNVNGVMGVRFNASVPNVTRVEYDAIAYPADLTDDPSSIPIVPREHRVMLSYGTACFLCIDKNDNRLQTYIDATKAAVLAMQKSNRKERIQAAKRMGHVSPRAPRGVSLLDFVQRGGSGGAY